MKKYLTTETIKGTALSLQSVDDIEGSDGLALGVFGIGDSITNDTLEEGLQNTTGLFVDHCDKTRQYMKLLRNNIEDQGY